MPTTNMERLKKKIAICDQCHGSPNDMLNRILESHFLADLDRKSLSVAVVVKS